MVPESEGEEAGGVAVPCPDPPEVGVVDQERQQSQEEGGPAVARCGMRKSNLSCVLARLLHKLRAMKNDRSKGTVCVTGGAGFIGSHVADAFLAAGHRVLIIDNLSGGKRENVPEGAELHVLDIRSEEAADLVRDAGVESSSTTPRRWTSAARSRTRSSTPSVNVLGSLNLAEAARRGGVRQILFASTGGAIYGEQDYFPADEDHPARPVSPYGVSKLSFERYLFYYHVAYGLDATCLRYANVYGERQNPHGEAGVVAIFLNRLLGRQAPTINGDGLQTRDYVHVSDVVRANLAAVGPPRLPHLQRGHRHRDLRRRSLQGDRPRPGDRSPGRARPGQAGGAAALGGRRRRSAAASSDLPQPIPLSEGLARTAAWFRERAERPVAAALGGQVGPAGICRPGFQSRAATSDPLSRFSSLSALQPTCADDAVGTPESTWRSIR